MTYAEAEKELADIKVAKERITGTTFSGGAQEYSLNSSRVVRVQYEALCRRETYLNGLKKRLNPNDGGGAVRQPIFETRS